MRLVLGGIVPRQAISRTRSLPFDSHNMLWIGFPRCEVGKDNSQSSERRERYWRNLLSRMGRNLVAHHSIVAYDLVKLWLLRR